MIVDATGVYADAGTATDHISVLNAVGSIMGSVEQFADNDAVDVTLNDIKVALATGGTQDAVKNAAWPGGKELHLTYSDIAGTQDFTTHDGTERTLENLTLRADAGWSKLVINQCDAHKPAGDLNPPHYETLGGTDISNLFARIALVQVGDVPT